MVSASDLVGAAPVANDPLKAAPLVPARPEFKLEVVSSNDLPFWSQFYLAVMGPAGRGKTHLAATMSAKYPDVWPPTAPLEIDDVLMINTDPNGQGALREARVTVKHVVDLANADPEEIFKMCRPGKLPKFIGDYLDSHSEIIGVAFDHGSGFFDSIFNFICGREKGKDSPKKYLDVANEGKLFLEALRAHIHVPVLYNFHIRKPPPHMEGMAGGASVEASIRSGSIASGVDRDEGDYNLPGRQIADVVRNFMTLSASLITSALPGGKSERQLAFADQPVFTKRRLTLCVDPKEPAHLGKLFDKISSHIGTNWRGQSEKACECY